MRISNLMYSIRWRFVIIYLVLTAIVLGLVGNMVFSLVEDYFVTQRINDEMKSVNTVAVKVAPYVETSDSQYIFNILSEGSEAGGGRFLVLNNSGIVQADSFSTMNGIFLDYNEVKDIIFGHKSNSYGLHKIKNKEGNGEIWAIYYAVAIRSNNESIGVLLYSSSVQDLYVSINNLRLNMLFIYLVGCAVIIIVSIFSTNTIIKPVQSLTDAANKISAGDFSARVHIGGKSEIARFGNTFNMMCDKIQDVDMQRSEFVSNASHELKTPLASMKILVESILYQDNVEEKYYKEFLGDINSEIDRMTGLVEDLLLISKMDSDIAVLHNESNDISQIIKKIVTSLKLVAERKNVAVNNFATEECVVWCDYSKVYQAIYNLVENAIKYSKNNGNVKITLSKNNEEICVSVSDDGIGIPQANLPHIFERFYRVNKARDRESGGNGLGLHIVQKIALMHGGRVEVVSKEGEGSTFMLYLPLNFPANEENSHEKQS